jgi:alpha-1,6-mannosyltransferase
LLQTVGAVDHGEDVCDHPRMSRDAWRTTAVAGLGVALVAVTWPLHGLTDLVDPRRPYVAAELVMVVICGLAATLLWRRARRRDVVIVLVVAVVARALLVPAAPTLSDDAYRFVWDGRVQAAGINPYTHVPADRRLVALRDWRVFTRVNRPHTRTLYPPANEVVFLAAHETAGDGIVPWKLTALALEAGAVALLLVLLARARVSRGRVVLYAWHPIAIVEIAGSGHPDPLMVLALLATLLLWDARRRVAAGVALGVAALAKVVPLLAAPFLARRLGGRFLVAAAATCTALYLPYVGAGTHALGSVSSFVDQRFGAGPYTWLLAAGAGRTVALGLLLALLAIGVAWATARPPEDLAGACRLSALLLGGALLASHTVLPWYLLWVLPLLCVAPVPALLWACATAPVLYLAMPPDRILPAGATTAIVWAPTLALLALDASRSWSRRRRSTAAARAPEPESAAAGVPAPGPAG